MRICYVAHGRIGANMVRPLLRDGHQHLAYNRTPEKTKEIEYSIVSVSGKDLEISTVNEKVVIAFAYDKEIELMAPVYLLIKYEGRSR